MYYYFLCFFLATAVGQSYLRKCNLEIKEQSICIKYQFNDENCFPWDTSLCQVVTVSANERHCGTWNCYV